MRAGCFTGLIRWYYIISGSVNTMSGGAEDFGKIFVGISGAVQRACGGIQKRCDDRCRMWRGGV